MRKKITNPILYGLLFGLFDASLMLPLEFENKVAAIAGAFLQRFAIGFLIPFVRISLSGVLGGILVSFLVSLPTAIITGSYLPIMTTGIIGGALIGWHAEKTRSKK